MSKQIFPRRLGYTQKTILKRAAENPGSSTNQLQKGFSHNSQASKLEEYGLLRNDPIKDGDQILVNRWFLTELGKKYIEEHNL